MSEGLEKVRLGLAGIGGEGRSGGAVVGIEAQLQLGGLGHASGVPRRVEDHIDMNLPDAGEAGELAFDVALDDVAHATARSSHGHGDGDLVATLWERLD